MKLIVREMKKMKEINLEYSQALYELAYENDSVDEIVEKIAELKN